jgi:hypothetical protein
LTNQECVVIVAPQMLENLRRVFLKSKDKNAASKGGLNMAPESVLRETFLENVVDDAYFVDAKLEETVRISVDGEAETLDALLLRVSTTHKSEQIRWDEFLTFFCRRGKLRETEKLVF